MTTLARRSTHVVRSRPVVDDGDMRLYRVLPSPQRTSIGPFVVFDHYRHTSLRGIGDQPHPHAGIEVLSYLLEGGVEHRDSLGSRDRLLAGDAQCIRAGRGVVHAEQPLSGRHGLQLWTSLPSELKSVEPAYRSWRAAEIPAATSDAGSVRVVAGTVDAMTGPMVLARPTTLAVVHLAANASLDLQVDPDAELAIYVIDGAVDGVIDGAVDGDGEEEPSIRTGGLAMLSPGPRLVLASHGGRPAAVAVFGGVPIDEPILFSGPFVMDSPERLERARRDYASGRMGRLA